LQNSEGWKVVFRPKNSALFNTSPGDEIMKTIRNAALFVVCLGIVAASSDSQAGCKGKGGFGGHHGHHGHHHRYRRVYVKPIPPPIVHVTVIPVGSVITLPGYFGRHPGHVLMEFGGAKVHAKVISWSHYGIKVFLPPVDLACPTAGSLIVIRWDKYAFRPFPVKFLPPMTSKPAIVPAGPPAGGPILVQPAAFGQSAGVIPTNTAPNAKIQGGTLQSGTFGQGGIPFQQ